MFRSWKKSLRDSKRAQDTTKETRINYLVPVEIDERVYDKVTFNPGVAIAKIVFKFEEDESVIRGFLGLAEYYRSVVVKKGDQFFIPYSSILFQLISS